MLFGPMCGDAVPPGPGASPGRDAGAASPVGDALDVVAAVPAHESLVLLRPGLERQLAAEIPWPTPGRLEE
jgi:hypothetical protein